MNVHIRPFAQGDGEQLVDILKQNGQFGHPEVEGIAAMCRVASCDAAVFLVAEVNGEPVGLRPAAPKRAARRRVAGTRVKRFNAASPVRVIRRRWNQLGRCMPRWLSLGSPVLAAAAEGYEWQERSRRA